jgi:hypothetical protein
MTKRPQLEVKKRADHDGRTLATRGRGPTGPRTELGKQRSKLNSVKYGIFSNVLLLGSESREEFDELVSGLRDDYQPVGKLEETLVDHLTVTFWRLRRLLTAEVAEIARSMPAASFQDDDLTRLAVLRRMFNFGQGMFSSAFINRSVPDLTSAISTMNRLRDTIEREGLSWQRDREMLEDVFGKSNEPQPGDAEEQTETAAGPSGSGSSKSLISRYREAAESNYEDDESAAQAAEAIVSDIDTFLENAHEVCRHWIEQDEIDRVRQRDAALIPKPEVAEKLLRYQIMLDRSVERTLTQLERLQRMRLGQPVAPPIKVQLAG